MARLTVEDCVERVSNRFELVLLAAQRARDLGKGAELTVDKDNDKHPVIALREIADDTISLDAVRRKLVYGSETEEDENADNVEELGLAADNPLDRAFANLDLDSDQHNEAWGTGIEDGSTR